MSQNFIPPGCDSDDDEAMFSMASAGPGQSQRPGRR
jgi:hypothetical protein